MELEIKQRKATPPPRRRFSKNANLRELKEAIVTLKEGYCITLDLKTMKQVWPNLKDISGAQIYLNSLVNRMKNGNEITGKYSVRRVDEDKYGVYCLENEGEAADAE